MVQIPMLITSLAAGLRARDARRAATIIGIVLPSRAPCRPRSWRPAAARHEKRRRRQARLTFDLPAGAYQVLDLPYGELAAARTMASG